MTGDSFDLTGKTVLVVGATSNIGSACAVACAERGATIVASGRNAERLSGLLASLADRERLGHQALRADITEQAGRDALASHAVYDGVIYAAGTVSLKPITVITERDLREHSAVNCDGAVLLVQALLRKRALRSGASVVFLSSIMAMVTTAGNASYSASKGALSSVVRTLALELAPLNIRANCLCPAMVESGMAQYTKAIAPDAFERHRAEYPLGFGHPDDVANAAVFLLSRASRWITGTNLVMDGGLSLR